VNTNTVLCTACTACTPWTSFVAAVDEAARATPGRISPDVYLYTAYKYPGINGCSRNYRIRFSWTDVSFAREAI